MQNNHKNIGFMGFETFVWFQGVVEDRIDPLKLGRVKVRVLGIHTDQKNKIPTEDLPWAYPIQPITSPAMNGLGTTPLGPVEGTWVVGFFRDGQNCQEPVIFGTLAGIPPEYPYPKSRRVGFLDPRKDLSKRPRKYKTKKYPNDGNGAILEQEIPTPPTGESYPRIEHPFGSIVGENDVNRLARNEKIDETIVKLKKDERDLEIKIFDEDTWDEPETPYNSDYPYNHVLESESGHIIEIDDTPNLERIHLYHKSGTFQEIYPDGIKVEKIVGNNYKIVMEEQYEHIQNRYNLTIDGPFNVYVRNNAKLVVCGDLEIEVGGNMTTTVNGDYVVSAKGNCTIESEKSLVAKSGTSATIGSGGSVNLKGSAVISNPPVDKSLVTGAVTVIVPSPAPQTVSVEKVDDEVVERTYPKPIPTYG